jgi:hypothetical protein
LQPSNFELLPPRQVDLRPARRPAQDVDWTNSRVALTMLPIQYSNGKNDTVRILQETVSVALDSMDVQFTWFNEVDLKADGCGSDWLCIKKGLSAQVLEPQSAMGRDTMFLSTSSSGLTWGHFITFVLTSTSSRLSFIIRSNAETGTLFGSSKRAHTGSCLVDLAALRDSLEKSGFAVGKVPLPFRVSPSCIGSA